RWEVLWPPGGPPGAVAGDANDASVTLLVRTAGLTVLLTGDIEPAAQRRLLSERPGLSRVDALKVAHHGSRFQHGPLLDRLRPRIALISAGEDNPYGHPAPDTLRALWDAGAVVSRTDVNGALALTRRPDGTPAVVPQRGGPWHPERRTAGAPRSPPPRAPPVRAKPRTWGATSHRAPALCGEQQGAAPTGKIRRTRSD
ncbi:ComEC/Rec2 family competence protein, partial [Streptomyces boncukensis]|uniref:ComEC/Rec2 family competence protein n=1 Tax=Streptomyces boncukensis TaxID=2711219 RepID=UPI003B9759E9